MKNVFVILDGVADRPVKEFNGLTPVEEADTPFLDHLAKNGICGEMSVMGKYPPETDSGVLAVFGYDPLIYSRGRGPLEAYGVGLNFDKGDLILRCNFATLEDSKIIDTRAGRIETKDARKLIDYIQENLKIESYPVDMRFIHTLNYRSILLFHPIKEKLSDQISNTHPGYERKPGYLELPKHGVKVKKFEKCRPLDSRIESKISANLVNEFSEKSHLLLKEHEINKKRIKEGINPANAVLMRGAGITLPELDDFKKKYGTSWLCIGDTPAERGIARLLGMELLDLPEPLCDKIHGKSSEKEIKRAVKTDMKIRVKKLLENFNNYDCFYIHIKGADPFGHAGLPESKKTVVETIDKIFFGRILDEIDLTKTMFCVTSDHCTACSTKSHTADPVPVVISGCDVEPDNVKRFGESFCRKGIIGKIKAVELMNILMNNVCEH